MVRSSSLVVACLMWAGLHSPAAAARVDAACIWALVQPAVRDRLAVAYADGGRERVDQIDLAIPAENAMTCTGAPEDLAEARRLGEQFGKMSVTISMEVISREYLNARGYTDAKLDAAWHKLGPRDRASLRTIAQLLDIGPTPDDSERFATIILRASDLAGRPLVDPDEDPALTRFIDYFMSRAVREAFEAEE